MSLDAKLEGKAYLTSNDAREVDVKSRRTIKTLSSFPEGEVA